MNQPITDGSGASSLQLYHPDPCYRNYKAGFLPLSFFLKNRANMRDIVEWLEEWIMHGLWMNASERSCTEYHFKWKRLSYYWSHSLNSPGQECCADSQRASTTQREKSCIKDPQTFSFPNEAAASLHGLEDKVVLLHPCTSAIRQPGWATANFCQGNVRASFPRLGVGKVKVGNGSNRCLHNIIPPGGYLHWWIAVDQLAQRG